MKVNFLVTLLLLSLSYGGTFQAGLPASNKTADEQQNAPPDNAATGQTVALSEQGISFRLPKDWQNDGEPLATDRAWFQRWNGPDKLVLTVYISDYKPEYKQDSIKDSLNNYYNEQKRSGGKDVRYLEINGVRGVHYQSALDEVKTLAVKWGAQYIYKGKRRILEMSLLCPNSNFTTRREELYGILNSIQFLQN